MVFVVDDLAAWLVGLLADAGRKKLTTLVLGDAQERALRQAAIAAVQDTAGELSPSDGQRAGQIAMVISEVFRAPVPDAPLAGVATLVEGLQAGIAGQLAVLDDAGLTGTGQSSAEVLGVPGTVLADRLTGHLVREIMFRGSRGGPLTPLADQLNHDLTHLQGQRVEGMLARLAGEVRDALARPGSGAAAAGRPLDEVTDPFALEVHRPVQPEDPQPGLPALPAYVPREHDTELGSVVRAAAEGSSGIAVLVGGSSTGKTRACWEALQLLRDRPEQWRLWHPIDPSRPDAALRELPGIGPRTVVWLNEAQFYLDVADGGLGERVAAGLRELLRDPARAPVLVLATLWPQFWDGLTARPAGGADPHAQARELLAGHDITVPAAFTAAQLQRLSRGGGRAAGPGRRGGAGRAGHPVPGRGTRAAGPVPQRAARRGGADPRGDGCPPPGHGIGAAAGLPGSSRARVPDRHRMGRPGRGLAGAGPGLHGRPLQRRPRAAHPHPPPPGQIPRTPDPAPGTAMSSWLTARPASRACRCTGSRITSISTAGTTGRARSPRQASGPQRQTTPSPATRPRSVMPPTLAACTVTPPSSTRTPPPAATSTLFSTSATLRTTSALTSAPCAGPPPTSPSTTRTPWPGCWTACGRRARRSRSPRCCAVIPPPTSPSTTRTPWPGCWTACGRRARRSRPPRWPAVSAAHVALDDPDAVARLLDSLREAGAEEQVTALAERAAAHVPSTTRPPWPGCWTACGRRARRSRPPRWLRRDRRPRLPRRPGAVAGCWAACGRRARRSRPPRWPSRAAAHVSLDNPAAVAGLLDSLREAGAEEQAAALLRRDPAAHVSLDDPGAVAGLLDSLREAGAQEQVAALAEPRRRPRRPRRPARRGRAAGQPAGGGRARSRPPRWPTAPPPTSPSTTRTPWPGCWTACGRRARRSRPPRWLSRAAAHVSLDDPGAVARLLDSLREAGAEEQATALAEPRSAAHVSLDDPGAVARLLDSLREAGAERAGRRAAAP